MQDRSIKFDRPDSPHILQEASAGPPAVVANRRGFAGLLGGFLCLSTATPALACTAAPSVAPKAGLLDGPSADDRFALLELIARYAWAYDTEDAAALAATFTEDGVLEVWGKVMASGRAAFAPLIDQARMMKGEHGWQHLADHHIFRDYDGQRCTIYSYYTMPESDDSGGNVTVRAMGYYISHCQRTNEGWLFEKRSVARWNGKAPMKI